MSAGVIFEEIECKSIINRAQAKGMGLEEVLGFSRHRDVKVLLVYRDRERDVQGQLATLVATGAVPHVVEP